MISTVRYYSVVYMHWCIISSNKSFVCAYAEEALVNNRFVCTVLAHKHTMGLGIMYSALFKYMLCISVVVWCILCVLSFSLVLSVADVSLFLFV